MYYNDRSRKVISIIAFILGILSLLLFFVPLFRFVLPISALILGIIGILKKDGIGLAISGTICASISLIVAIIISIMLYTPDSNSSVQSSEESKVEKCEIIFLADGVRLKEYYVNKGDMIEAIQAPEKEGYVFSHWATHNKSIDGSEVFDFSKPVQTHTTLFAHYKIKPVENKKTKENYNRIQNGMTKEDVTQIMGKPDSISENEIEGYGKTEMYNYSISTYTGCQIYFHNGIVYMKNWTSI